MNEQERKAAVARVIARGSNPAAIAEAEGDFGLGGTFAMTTTELLHRIETERLTAREMRAIRAELKSREI